jgi:REP element-mobilizing transposase RayT
LHVTLRMRNHVWQLRSRRMFGVLERAFYMGCERLGGRICQFSVQHNHIHLLVEAKDARPLARALQGLCIRMAKGLNQVMGRKGAVFADRYHARSLETPTQVRRALVYVLGNGRKHLSRVGHHLPADWLDPFSSAAWFDGWSLTIEVQLGPGPVARPETWLLSRGYQRAGGRIRPDEAPAGGHHERAR